MAVHAHTGTAIQHERGWTIRVNDVRVGGQPLTGQGATRDAAFVDAKKNLARHLNVGTHDVTLVVSSD